MTTEARATAAVTEFFTRASIKSFPRETVSLAKHFITDGLGVILAGSTTRGSAIVRDYIGADAEAH